MTTRAQLVTDVDQWLARDDVSAGSDFASILLIAEANIARDIRCVIQETSTVLAFTAQSETLPTNFLELRGQPYLQNAPNPRASKLEYQTPDVITGDPAWLNSDRSRYYSIGGDGTDYIMWLAEPGAVGNPVNVILPYFARFPGLVGAGDTNWLLANHYDIFLYATLTAAAIYLQEETLEVKYETRYEKARDRLAKSENRKRNAMGSLVARGGPRTAV